MCAYFVTARVCLCACGRISRFSWFREFICALDEFVPKPVLVDWLNGLLAGCVCCFCVCENVPLSAAPAYICVCSASFCGRCMLICVCLQLYPYRSLWSWLVVCPVYLCACACVCLPMSAPGSVPDENILTHHHTATDTNGLCTSFLRLFGSVV